MTAQQVVRVTLICLGAAPLSIKLYGGAVIPSFLPVMLVLSQHRLGHFIPGTICL